MSGEKKSEYIFTWKIKNYSSCYQGKRKYIESPIFTVESLGDSYQWYLWLYPKGDSRVKDESFISCFLLWNGDFETPSIDFSIEIMGKMDIVLKCLETDHVFSEESPQWGWVRAMAIDKLVKEMDSWNEDILIIRCRIKCDKFKKRTICGSEACTTIDVDRRFFEWNVKVPLSFEHSESVFFQLYDTHNFEITLTSFLEGLNILIQLKEYHHGDISKPVIFKITFCNDRGSEIISKRAEHLFQDEERWKFPDFITKHLLEMCNPDSCKYEFILKCEIYVSKGTLSSSVEKVYFESSAFPYADATPKACSVTAMQNDFRNLFTNKKYSDVTVRAGNEEFHAHKLVLRARSPVFEAMFDQNMLENKTGAVNVTDVDAKTMKIFLEFVYTEVVEEMDCESAKKLMFAADKYQVQSLVNECVSFLKSVLSVENAHEIIAAADSINCESLKSYAIHFIVCNAAKILVTPDWTLWIRENVHLASDILSKLSTDLMRKYK